MHFLTYHASFEYAKEAIRLDCQDYLLITAMYEDIGAAVLKVVNRIKDGRESVRLQEYGKQAVKEKIDQVKENFGQKKTEKLVDTAICYIVEHLSSETLSVNEVAEKPLSIRFI